MWKFISNETNRNESKIVATDICGDKIHNKKSNIYKKSPKHTLLIKRQNISVDYREKSFDDFRLMILDPPQKLDIEEAYFFCSFGISSVNLSNEVISKMVVTRLLKRRYEIKTQLHPSFSAMTLPEHIYLKIWSIIMK